MGTTPSERDAIYDKVFRLLVSCNITTLPVLLYEILDFLEVSLIPLSRIIRACGFSKEEVFDVWGNKDGHLMTFISKGRERFRIAYNDLDFPKGRVRFTIAEEIAHIVLGHYKNAMYRIDDKSKWYDDLYQNHEEQARMAAGLILCPPPVFYLVPEHLNIQSISGLCNVTLTCAKARYRMLLQHRHECQNRNSYVELRNQFSEFILSRRCSVCRHGFIRYDEVDGLCNSCGKMKESILVQ